MNVREIEEAVRVAWPALEEEELPVGVLRYANGIERRTNALSLHPDADLVPVEYIEAAEKYFRERSVAPVIRIVRSDGSSLPTLENIDNALAHRGYEKQSPTQTMLLDLTGIVGCKTMVKANHLAELSTWLSAWYEITGKPLEGIAVHREILEKLELHNVRFLSLAIDGIPLSTGMAVLSERAVGIFGIASAASHRQQGHASAVLASLLHWALMRGARFAYLQVAESNQAAINLYRKLGFTRVYSHWYRVGTQIV